MVYFIENTRTGLIKIGHSNNPAGRLDDLRTGSSDPLKLLGSMPGGRAEEQRLHYRFKTQRVIGEWFLITWNDVVELIADYWAVSNRERQRLLPLDRPAEVIAMKAETVFTVIVQMGRRAA